MDVASQRNGVPAAAPEERTGEGQWIDVCGLDDIVPQTGVCALLGRKQVAVFRVAPSDDLYALSNFDPFSKAFVLSRGIVGDKGGTPKVASPVFKQSFDLRTGQCLDDPAVSVKSYPVRLRAGRVEVFFTPDYEKPKAS
ncbi:MAG TPA: nitrite reductase small subunit NirD [Polyangia bacterium]|nr:nitrite reductase small subunit NirD [Polyangia bacterium]